MNDENLRAILEGLSQKKQESDGKPQDQRKHFRHPVRWRVAIVNKNGGQNDIYHGRTHDMSISGASVLIESNVYFSSDVVVLLAIPPVHHGQKDTILEIQCRVMHTILDSAHGMFRLGMRFIQFKGDGKKILTDVLSKRHIPKQDADPHQLHKYI